MMTTQTLRNGQSIELDIPSGQSVSVVAVSGTYNASITAGPGIGAIATAATGGTYGPYTGGGSVIQLTSSASSEIDFEVAVTPSVASDTPAFLATNPLTGEIALTGVVTSRLATGASVVQTLDETIFAQGGDGKYWCTQNDATYGVYGDQLFTATGAPGSLTKTALTNTRGLNLLTNAGGALAFVNPAHVWPLPAGGAIYSGKGPSNKWYLFKVTAAGTVGANAGLFNDKKAVLDIGTVGGTQSADIGTLTNKSMCVATIGGATVLILGEYNVNTSRTTGSTNDQVRVWKSTDDGATWTVLLEFNTAGSNVCRHIHAVTQDYVTGQIYIAIGDDPKAAIIRWDGTSAAPAANSTYAQIAATAGWSVLTDATNKFRTCDVLRVGSVLSYMRDSSLPADFLSQLITSGKTMVPVNGMACTCSTGRDPIFGVEIPGGGALYFSMWLTPTSPARAYDVFRTVNGTKYEKIFELPDYGAATSGVIGAAFIDQLGNLLVSGCNPKGSVLKAGTVGGTVVLQVA